MDLDRKTIQIREAVEQTHEQGARFKESKSEAGRRDITLPDVLVHSLREHRKAQLEAGGAAERRVDYAAVESRN